MCIRDSASNSSSGWLTNTDGDDDDKHMLQGTSPDLEEHSNVDTIVRLRRDQVVADAPNVLHAIGSRDFRVPSTAGSHSAVQHVCLGQDKID